MNTKHKGIIMNGIYELQKEALETVKKFVYVPDDYWKEIEFDTTVLLIVRKKKKDIYYYTVSEPQLLGYAEAWKYEVHINDIELFESVFKKITQEEENYIKQIIIAKQFKKWNL